MTGARKGDTMKHGDFTKLADKYGKYRPMYAPFVLDTFTALLKENISTKETILCADVGAGTGIWSRQLAGKGMHINAVEPNDAMRDVGIQQTGNLDITWHTGSAENTNLPDASQDAVCMASSFHWPDFDAAVREFNRILKPHGLFLALWNTRFYECNPLLVKIENHLHELLPNLNRVSSGRSEFCNHLTKNLTDRKEFKDVLYLEGRHIEKQSIERYIGLWESVNDIRVQAGEDLFAKFLEFIRNETRGLEYIEAEYLTRAWIARKA